MASENKSIMTRVLELSAALATLILFARDMMNSQYLPAVLTLIVFAALVSGFYRSRRFRGRLMYTFQSIRDYFPSFHVEDNRPAWDRTKIEYCYLGASTQTIKPLLIPWLAAQSRNDARRFRFLLLDPEGSAIQRQICNELNLPSPPQDPKHEFHTRLQAARANIQAGLASLRGTPQFQSKLLEVRLYDDYCSWWMHIIDGKDLYLGLLEEGRQGIDGPVIVFRKVSGQFTLFNSFLEHWERLWDSAKPVS